MSGEAAFREGDALWTAGDTLGAMGAWERAYTLYQEAGDAAAAARVARVLAIEHEVGFANDAVANGWIARAERLVVADTSEAVWLELHRVRRDPDLASSASRAERIIERARELGDRNLEVTALGVAGRAVTLLGDADRGFRLLDEALVAVTGEPLDFRTVADVCCSMIIVCERTLEIERAVQWCRITDNYAKQNMPPLRGFCRTTYASVLICQGRWAEADSELREALAGFRASHPAMSVHPLVRLALLRLCQGRLEEAEEFLTEVRDHSAAARVRAALELARGEHAVAASRLERRIALAGADVVTAAPLYELLVTARLSLGDRDGALEAASRLDAIAATTGRRAARALADRAAGVVAGDCARLQAAFDAQLELGMPYEAACTRLALARVLAGEPAIAEARAALATFDELGAARDADAAAELLRSLGSPGRPAPRRAGTLSKREDEVLALLGEGMSNKEIGERLFISAKTVEHHVGQILAKLELKNRATAAAYATKKKSGDR